MLENEALRKQVRSVEVLLTLLQLMPLYMCSPFVFIHKQLGEIQTKRKRQFFEFDPVERRLSISGSTPMFNCSADENELSDTSLQLG